MEACRSVSPMGALVPPMLLPIGVLVPYMLPPIHALVPPPPPARRLARRSLPTLHCYVLLSVEDLHVLQCRCSVRVNYKFDK